ncbi:class I SAM-dependent methyltransferase [Fulvimarina sp. 2208YS6-2-32]|uniref:Class I SAM-dependent methyltransferase n=1 Tax=Fulvimarina uroteuthidis TaxID=3098149 RepID=A0ABU5I895_9HYPH|nr:class I SAM-dependent methyltransferase [Fulvimarina sp. 2208YS6-2-32]MDY8111153.1 class I SAM-dependent methyltransferase [Fulvimarina sp. 2208YS6-2-32]
MGFRLEWGFRRITVLDLSETALARTRARLLKEAPVDWVVENVVDWKPNQRFDI